MRPFYIRRSLYRAVIWMGMERVPAIVYVMCLGFLGVTGVIYAKAYLATGIIVAIASAGTFALRKIAVYDPFFFKIINKRKNYEDNYPAYESTVRQRNG